MIRPPIPLYYQISLELRQEIVSGTISPGSKLPGEITLARKYGVSSITIRAALRLLIDDGYIQRYPGKGTFVSKRQEVDQYLGLGSINDFVTPIKQSEMRLLAWKNIAANPYIAEKLSVSPHTKIRTARIVRRVQGEPFLTVDVFFPPQIGELIKKEDLLAPEAQTKLLMEIVEAKAGVRITDIRQTMTIGFANDRIARTLTVERRTPLLVIEREFFAGARIVQYSHATYRTDKHRFRINISRVHGASGMHSIRP